MATATPKCIFCDIIEGKDGKTTLIYQVSYKHFYIIKSLQTIRTITKRLPLAVLPLSYLLMTMLAFVILFSKAVLVVLFSKSCILIMF